MGLGLIGSVKQGRRRGLELLEASGPSAWVARCRVPLHDLVARAEGPTEALDADFAGWVQRSLQLDIERSGPQAAPVHQT